MAQVVWLTAAIEDLDSIRAFVETSSPGRAATLVRRILAAVDRLREFPRSGRPRTEDSSARDLVVPPFRIEYLVLTDRVVIVAIKHGALDVGPDTVHEAPGMYAQARP